MRISSAGLPAAATRPIGTGVFIPGITKRSPTSSPMNSRCGASSRYLASMRSM
jgi:hypothetical protein